MSGTELLIVLAAVVVGTVVKSVTGMGLPIIAIPVASIFVDLTDAVVVLSVPSALSNLVLAAQARSSRHDARDLPVLAGFGIAGAVVGTLLLVNVPEEPLIVALIVVIVGYVATFFLRPDLRTSPARSRRWSPVVGATAGTFQGAIGISGPLIGSWIHSYRLPRDAHIFSVTSLFLIIGFGQLVVLAATGEFGGRVTATVLACIPVLAAIPIGTRLRSRVSRRAFDLAVVGLLA
ncbi:MAG: TSUP family transporter, partial [Ilumatobacteraceae bacterium]